MSRPRRHDAKYPIRQVLYRVCSGVLAVDIYLTRNTHFIWIPRSERDSNPRDSFTKAASLPLDDQTTCLCITVPAARASVTIFPSHMTALFPTVKHVGSAKQRSEPDLNRHCVLTKDVSYPLNDQTLGRLTGLEPAPARITILYAAITPQSPCARNLLDASGRATLGLYYCGMPRNAYR